jgi:hypothetical protein
LTFVAAAENRRELARRAGAMRDPEGSAHTIRPAAGSRGRHGVTHMGHDYYPEWLDNLADDVTLEAAAMDGTRAIRGRPPELLVRRLGERKRGSITNL